MSYTGSQLASVDRRRWTVVSFGYGSGGLLTSLTLPDGASVTYAYTGGLLTSVTGPRGGVTKYGYNSAGQLTTDHRPRRAPGADQRLQRHRPDHLANQRRREHHHVRWDAARQTATITATGGGVAPTSTTTTSCSSQIDAISGVTYYSYDSNLDLTQITDPIGNRTEMTYDGAGNMLSRTAPAPLYYNQEWTYNTFNEVLTTTDGRGRQRTTATTPRAADLGHGPRQHQAGYSYYPDGQLKTAHQTPTGRHQIHLHSAR